MKMFSLKNFLILLKLLTILIFLLLIFNSEIKLLNDEEERKNSILINQLGYRPDDNKIAFLNGTRPEKFEIKDVVTDEIVLNGNRDSLSLFDRSTGDYLYTLNFSALKQPGVYYIFIPSSSNTSFKFNIKKNVYNESAVRTLESFYYQRCGQEINNGTEWNHPVCHLRQAAFYKDNSKKMDVSGGWHDAGDYNKFVPTTSVSAAFLLYAYEDNPNYFSDGQLNIPESQNSIPDILDEVRYALNWLIKMQREDGAFYHKVSIKKWTGDHLPHLEPDNQYIFGICSNSTAAAAAVTALGAKLFQKYEEQFSKKLLDRSIKAWNFLKQNPENIPPDGFKNPPDVEGGEYNDNNDSDERLWASVELYKATGSKEYLEYFLLNYKNVGGPNYTVSWMNTANFAYYSFLKLKPHDNIEARDSIIFNLKNYCNDLVNRINSNGYKCALKENEYYWGSNSVVAGYAYDLINANIITDQKQYSVAALDQLHYLLGRNTFGISFITGIGSNAVKNPYHQFSMIRNSDNPVPGLLVGGPNNYSHLNGKVISGMPGKCYEDNEKNYYVNETAINYMAPFVYVASYFSNIDNLK